MDWKREAMDKLRQYEAKKQALTSIPEELKRLELAAKGMRGAIADGTPVSGGGSGREDMLLSNIVHRDELKRAFDQARIWVDLTNAALDVLSDDERLILDRFYIHPAKGNVDRLCEELGIEKPTAYRRRDKALRRFTICLYGCTEN